MSNRFDNFKPRQPKNAALQENLQKPRLHSNATLRMWINRYTRVSNAWSNTGQSHNGRPWFTQLKGWWTANILALIGLIVWVYEINQADRLLSMRELFKFMAFIMFLHGITWLMVKPSAKWHEDNENNTIGFWVSSVIGILIGCTALSITIKDFYSFKPVSQKIYDSIKADNPGCNRYNDYRIDRIEKNMIFTIMDLRLATLECNAITEKTQILNLQKTIK